MTNENSDARPPSPASSTPPPETPPPETPPPETPPPETSPSETSSTDASPGGTPPPASTTDRRARPEKPTSLPTVLIALGVGLVAGGIAVAATFSRDEGELDVPVYAVGLVATALLLVLSAACSVWAARSVPGSGHDVRNLAGWSGAVGVLGLAVLLALGLEDVSHLGYLLGGLVTGLSLVGYAVSRHGAFVVTAVLGLGVLYARAFEDVFGGLVDGPDPAAVVAAGLAGFVAGVTVVGWLLPTRVLSAQVAGWIGLVGTSMLLAGVVVVTLVQRFFDDMFGDMFGEGSPFASPDGMEEEMPGGMEVPGGMDMPGLEGELPDLTNDVWLVLAVAAGLMLWWALAGARTKHSGFTLLAVVMPVVTVPLATVALTAEQPTIWIAALAAPGGVLLVVATLLAVRRR